ncbi:MAG: PD-(D/E)XK nuclease family protein [Verrucomicrobiales bacterium]
MRFRVFQQSLKEPADIARRFLGWDRPVLEATVDHLANDWDRSGPLDLADLLVVVPTRNAGRRLREALAIRAAESDAVVFPPLVTTQDFLVAPDRLPDSRPVADRHATLLLWSALLLDVDLNRFRRVFPVDPVDRNLSWAMKTAKELLDVGKLLADSGLTFATASETLGEQDMEPARWRELADLEALALKRIGKLGFRDEAETRLEAANTGSLPSEVRRISVVATPDLRPLSAAALARISKTLPVEILVHAPETDAGRFDPHGRPVPAQWLDEEIPIPEPGRTIHQAATPSEQARLACDLIGDLPNPGAFAAFVVPDPEVVAPLRQAAAQRGWTAHDPAGLPVSRHGIYYLLELTARLVETGSFESAAQLFRCPDFARACVGAIRSDPESDIGATRLVSRLDDLAVDALPHRLDDAVAAAKRHSYRTPAVEKALKWLRGWRDRFRRGNFGETLAEYLSTVFAHRRFSAGDGAHDAFAEVADAILEAEYSFQLVGSVFAKSLAPEEQFQLVLELIRERRLYEERRVRDIDLQGWLEMLWEDAPHLVVTGMNDNFVPEATIGHAFLPDAARRVLGMFHNDDRFARDAYLFAAALASRKKTGGRVDLIFGRESDSSDPLRPSRLLFQCPDEELAGRTLSLFADAESGVRPLARSTAFPLRPEPLDPENRVFERLGVSALKQYLACPFRFYLCQGLRMEKVETDKREMDAADFGNLVHEALDRFAASDSIRESTDAERIAAWFRGTLDEILGERFGNRLATPIVIQRESARKRLAWWAEIEAGQRADGWKIVSAEEPFGTEEWPFAVDETTVRGRIDRIETHPEHGLRVLDFKTISPFQNNKLKSVDEYHLVPLKAREDPVDFPDWALVENAAGKPCRWADLQIPIYLLAMRERHPDTPLTAGYATLGKTANEVRIDTWETLDAPLLDAARDCAAGVVRAVRDEIFWPPSSDAPPWDDFLDLLAPDPDRAVDSTLLGHRSNPV